MVPNNIGDKMANDPVPEEEPTHETIYKEMSDEDKGILAEIDFDLRDTGRWLLKVIGGPNNGAEFYMQTGTSYVIGTDPNTCDVIFHDTSVSRQHARVSISDNDSMTIEDLKSRNGTMVDGEKIHGRKPLEPNTVVSLGTTSFLIFDREGDMQTIISPLLPSIVKVLQQEEEKKKPEDKENSVPNPQTLAEARLAETQKPEEKPKSTLGAFVLIGIVTALFVIVGIGTTTLFQSTPVKQVEQVDINAEIGKALAMFPSVKWTYNKGTGNLLLAGHVLTSSDKYELLNSLQGLKLKSIDDSGVVIDEGVWRETNQVLARDQRWKGISVHSPSPGKFVLDGFLQTRKQAEELSDYITANFPYLDLLERRVVVGEDVMANVNNSLDSAGIKGMKIDIKNQELSLSGSIPNDKTEVFEGLIKQFKEIPGVRNVRTYITQVEPQKSLINVSDRYRVTGFSHQGGTNLNVVINGRILMKGDSLDGMTITNIKPNAILLEKEGVQYQIDYNIK